MIEVYLLLREGCIQVISEFGILFIDMLLIIEMNLFDYISKCLVYLIFDLNNDFDFYIIDYEVWIFLWWLYKVRGGEQFFMMGFFVIDEEVNVILLGLGGINVIYYYVDDVCIEYIFVDIVNFGLFDMVFCEQFFSMELFVVGLYSSYVWSMGDIIGSIMVIELGVYIVEVVYEEFVIWDMVIVQYLLVEEFSFGLDIIVCQL